MKHYGFNFQWMLVRQGERPRPTDERALDFMASYGFNFVRIPMNYRVWTTDFDYLHPDESVFETLDGHLRACRERDLHVSLNLHHAPDVSGTTFPISDGLAPTEGIIGDGRIDALSSMPASALLLGRVTRRRHRRTTIDRV